MKPFIFEMVISHTHNDRLIGRWKRLLHTGDFFASLSLANISLKSIGSPINTVTFWETKQTQDCS